MKSVLFRIAVAGAIIGFAPSTFAAAKTYVSQTGSDSNTAANCSRGSPCRNFSAAYTVTNTGGEIVALDSTGYGQVSIGKAITISGAPGTTATVQVPVSSSGITVNAPSSDVVVLRNLVFSGSGANCTGINHASGMLIVQDSRFSALAFGIKSTAKSSISDSDFVGNGIGLQVTGEGSDQQGNPNMNACVAACAVVRGGSFVGNTTALASVSSVLGKENIFIRSLGSGEFLTHFEFNGTFFSPGDNVGQTQPSYISAGYNMSP